MSISITRRVDSKSGVLVVFTMRLITMSFFLTAVCKQGDRKGVRARTHKATIHIWEFRSLVISAAKIIRLGKKDRPNQAKSKLLLWLNFVADLRTATTSLCTTSYGIVTFPERDVQVTGFRLARFCSNSKPPNRVAQSRKVDDTMEALLSKPARPRLAGSPASFPRPSPVAQSALPHALAQERSGLGISCERRLSGWEIRCRAIQSKTDTAAHASVPSGNTIHAA